MKAALVLGAAVRADGASPSLRRRTERAAALWHQGVVGLIVPCGGLGRHPPTEAAAMTAILRAAGVPADRIVPEPGSASTAENIAFALPILRAAGVTEVVLVTDAYHAPRAWLTARAHGLKASTASPPLKGAHLPTQARLALREVPALLYYLWRYRRALLWPGDPAPPA